MVSGCPERGCGRIRMKNEDGDSEEGHGEGKCECKVETSLSSKPRLSCSAYRNSIQVQSRIEKQCTNGSETCFLWPLRAKCFFFFSCISLKSALRAFSSAFSARQTRSCPAKFRVIVVAWQYRHFLIEGVASFGSRLRFRVFAAVAIVKVGKQRRRSKRVLANHTCYRDLRSILEHRVVLE